MKKIKNIKISEESHKLLKDFSIPQKTKLTCVNQKRIEIRRKTMLKKKYINHLKNSSFSSENR